MEQQPYISPSYCQIEGHKWISTTGINFRMCGRFECKAVQRWCLDGWVDVAQAPAPKKVYDAVFGNVDPSRRPKKGRKQAVNIAYGADLKNYWK